MAGGTNGTFRGGPSGGASHNDVWLLYAEPWRKEVKTLLDQARWADRLRKLPAPGLRNHRDPILGSMVGACVSTDIIL